MIALEKLSIPQLEQLIREQRKRLAKERKILLTELDRINKALRPRRRPPEKEKR